MLKNDTKKLFVPFVRHVELQNFLIALVYTIFKFMLCYNYLIVVSASCLLTWRFYRSNTQGLARALGCYIAA